MARKRMCSSPYFHGFALESIYIYIYIYLFMYRYRYRNIKKNIISAGFIPSFGFPAGDGGPPREALLRPGLSRCPAVGPRAVPLRRWRKVMWKMDENGL